MGWTGPINSTVVKVKYFIFQTLVTNPDGLPAPRAAVTYSLVALRLSKWAIPSASAYVEQIIGGALPLDTVGGCWRKRPASGPLAGDDHAFFRVLGAELSLAALHAIARVFEAANVLAPFHGLQVYHLRSRVLGAELALAAALHAKRGVLRAAFENAPFTADVDHPVFRVLCAELSPSAPLHAIASLLGTGGVFTHPPHARLEVLVADPRKYLCTFGAMALFLGAKRQRGKSTGLARTPRNVPRQQGLCGQQIKWPPAKDKRRSGG